MERRAEFRWVATPTGGVDEWLLTFQVLAVGEIWGDRKDWSDAVVPPVPQTMHSMPGESKDAFEERVWQTACAWPSWEALQACA